MGMRCDHEWIDTTTKDASVIRNHCIKCDAMKTTRKIVEIESVDGWACYEYAKG
jgi:uncharacterized membrane protein